MILALALAAAAPAALGQGGRPTYTGVEASTDAVTPPAPGATTWTVQACPTCKRVTLKVDANSTYYVGKDQVSLDVLRRYAAKGPAQIGIFYENESLRLLRVVLSTQLDAADRSSASAPGKR
jgi:hypothetical protein